MSASMYIYILLQIITSEAPLIEEITFQKFEDSKSFYGSNRKCLGLFLPLLFFGERHVMFSDENDNRNPSNYEGVEESKYNVQFPLKQIGSKLIQKDEKKIGNEILLRPVPRALKHKNG
ncbi:hypothetical protein T01_1253 [Trichinella spiralis]|uniref:Uncharacterized protein n=1 Tax=Trichinella spiralis TaxID=6334 RepID=A0A0V1B4R4_TRISP|nr:hypothetical protein T01_1253 [Trichinella spiralis]